MSNSFDDRERAEEAKYALDQETQFKVMARRNKMLGLWAAEILGKSGAEAEAYAKEVVLSDLEEAGEEDVFRKVRGDFDAAGVARPDSDIREQMAQLIPVARDAVLKG
jgi:hypothetical protein